MEVFLGERRPQAFRERCRESLAEAKGILDGIMGHRGSRGPADTLLPLNRLSMLVGNLWNVISLLRSVHPAAEVRAAAEESEKEVARFDNELSLNRGLYEAVSRCDASSLDPAGRRMLRHVLRDFHRAGVDRDDATRERVRALREELVAIGQEFLRNISSDVRAVELDGPAELEGLPEDYIHKHRPGLDGRIRITTDYPDYNPYMSYARSSRRRRELYVEFRKRACPANVDVLGSLIRKRHELAALLGYPSWAAYAVEDKMIKTPEAIAGFIERVSGIAAARACEEYAALLAEKRRHEAAAEEVHDWEKSFYEEQVRTDRFRVDSKDVRPYFEYSRVKEGVLRLTEDLFGIRFLPSPGAPAWHDDVEALDVVEDGRKVGRIYLDMHPREGKFKHAAMFPLVRGVRGVSVPEAVLVCNFPRPGEGPGPALLEHDDVLTLLHELGHLLHQLFARDQEWARFSGTATEWDFIEVPSQLYEEWGWDYEVLRRFAVHHETELAIPQDLVERMRKARGFGRGLWARHQIFYAAVSLECFGPQGSAHDAGRVVREMQERYSLFRFVDGTCFEASFGHLDSYSALYYTYMWSLVIAKDLFEELKRRGSMRREVAAAYREHVLAPGGSRDAADLVRGFLGRDYSFGAFERWLEGTGG